MQFSAYNKAIAALVTSLFALIGTVFHVQLGGAATVITTVASIATPILVWAVPNVAKGLADGGAYVKWEELVATVARTTQENVLSGLAIHKAQEAAAAAAAVPVRQPDGMQRPA